MSWRQWYQVSASRELKDVNVWRSSAAIDGAAHRQLPGLRCCPARLFSWRKASVGPGRRRGFAVVGMRKLEATGRSRPEGSSTP